MQQKRVFKSSSPIVIGLKNNQMTLIAKNFTSSTNELDETVLELDLTENENRNEMISKSNQYLDLQDFKLEIDDIISVDIPSYIILKLDMEKFDSHTIKF